MDSRICQIHLLYRRLSRGALLVNEWQRRAGRRLER